MMLSRSGRVVRRGWSALSIISAWHSAEDHRVQMFQQASSHSLADSYAEIDMTDFWQGWRNPVRYMSFEDTGIDASKLTLDPVPQLENREPPRAAPILSV
jgi:hypothetical protein